MRCALVLLSAVIVASVAAGAEDAPVIRMVDFEDEVTPVSAERLIQAIDEAAGAGDALILVRLDTPGGTVTSLEDIVQRMLSSKTPIVVWVGPAGAKAASAGFVILIAADVAAMAPGTHTGAAAVIGLGGSNSKEDVGLMKASNDMAARARTIAEHRGRNVDACEKAVLAASAYTDGQAMKEKIIDLLAKDQQELLRLLDGREIRRLDGTSSTLRTAGARVVRTETTLRQRILGILANVQVAYLLLLLGLGGLYIELSHPGLIFPGVVGVLCLLLFAFAAQVLPVSSIGLMLILLAIVMFILEIKVVSYGMLTFGGALCLVLGSLMLFRGPIPELRLSLAVVLPASLLLTAFCVMAVRLAVRAQAAPVSTGVEGLLGEVGTVSQALGPDGKVYVHGEIWNAVSATGRIERGERVRVAGVDGMKLTVEEAQAPSPRKD